MRKTINIIWIDDKMKRKGFSDLTEKNVRSALDAKGYKAFIVKHDDPDEALKYLNLHKETRWDFVLADLNLRDEEKSGIYLLTSLRSSGNQTPFFILYSNEEPEKVKKEISEAVKDPDSNLSLFSNYSVLPFSDFSGSPSAEERAWKKCFTAALCKWDEINAFRGEIIAENSILEEISSEIIKDPRILPFFDKAVEHCGGTREYGARIQCISYAIQANLDWKSKYSKVSESWDAISAERNAVAHCKESFSPDKGFYIYDKKIACEIRESEIDSRRSTFIADLDVIRNFINSEFPDLDVTTTIS